MPPQTTVTLSQNGRIISRESAGGPFVIKDLSQSIMGTIDVTVAEDNGKETKFQFTTTNIPFLTRGQARYTLNLGQLSPKNGTHANDNFMTVESSVGVFNHTSVFGGIVATSGNK
ncbi:fimbria/pilus outer membrane usher protein [Providencia rettgeri]|uniref:Fimbria/pilus outer membrane usher protein n=1 Tax=Providencia rettgeri TaxID=587 RepID=A0A939NBA1_PRORE|nr:fimbria/pilus outer membrane usher protein [Providencia rettgeri]